MKLPSKFLFSSLHWRGLKTSHRRLNQAFRNASYDLSASDFEVLMVQFFAITPQMARRWFDESQREYEWLMKNQVQISTVFDADFPPAFSHIDHAPTIVTYWGKLNPPEAPCLSVVGTRHPSRVSIDWMETEFDGFLKAKNDIVIVSGGARGIDQKAHYLALRNGRATICLLPSGLAHVYPRDLLEVKNEVMRSGGAIVSSLSPFSEMQKRFFIERNRYIANWSPLTFVVEAKRRSGTMITARWVRMLEHQLAVLPCSPMVAGLGGLDLLADGALIIRDRYDLNQCFESALVSCAPQLRFSQLSASGTAESVDSCD